MSKVVVGSFMMFAVVILSQEPKRTILLNEMTANVTELSERVRGTSLTIIIDELITRLKSISPADVEMLADPYRALDNELIDNLLVANNVVNQMREASDEELYGDRAIAVGALIYASNNIAEYVRTHHKRLRDGDRQF